MRLALFLSYSVMASTGYEKRATSNSAEKEIICLMLLLNESALGSPSASEGSFAES